MGNPRYNCVLDDGTYFYTGDSSSHGYSITNYLNNEDSLAVDLHEKARQYLNQYEKENNTKAWMRAFY